MTPAEIAQARYRMYQLFCQVMLSDMTDDLIMTINQLPEFDGVEPQSIDDWKADHYALFGMNVYPYETEFCAEDGFLGGKITRAVAYAYDEAGYQPDASETADHIGNQLGLMAFLSGEEASAHHDDVIQAVYHNTHLQRQFLDQHLLCWLPSLVMAIHQQGDKRFSILADLMLDLAFKHRQLLGEDSVRPTHPLTLPPVPNILDQDHTGLKDIAGFLLTPAYTGIYLSRDDIIRIGKQFDLPRSYGKRQQMLTRLFHIAIDHNAIDDLMSALQAVVDLWRSFYSQRIPDPRFSDSWLHRLDGTIRFLQMIRDAL